MGAIEVGLVDGADAALVRDLTELINAVYAIAEDGLWQDGAARTSEQELAGLIAAREIAVATAGGRIAGAVRVRALSDSTGEFGMLVAAPEHRGIGVGRALVDFAERLSRDRGLRTMQLDLLVPRAGSHPSKVFLDRWYRRTGYRVVRTAAAEDAYPALAPRLATECEIVVYQKPL
jgi:GNAT superfamily N-acetyltransferase